MKEAEMSVTEVLYKSTGYIQFNNKIKRKNYKRKGMEERQNQKVRKNWEKLEEMKIWIKGTSRNVGSEG